MVSKPKAVFRLRERDRGWNALKQTAKTIRARGAYVKVGVLGGRREGGSQLDNVELAAIHEFGAPGAGIPERSFIRRAFEANRTSYWAILEKGLPHVYEGRLEVRTLLSVLGMKLQSDIKRGLTSGTGVPPPLAPSTVRAKLRKGDKLPAGRKSAGAAPRPLVDTGQLLNSIHYAVVLDGRGDEAAINVPGAGRRGGR